MAAELNACTIHINTNGQCRVVMEAARRSFFSTPRAVGLALLATSGAEQETSSDLVWSDFLASHGIAIGTRGRQRVTVALLPPKTRTVSVTRRDDSGLLTCTPTFPPLMLIMLHQDGNWVRGLLYRADATRQGQMAVTASVAVLGTFPFGNVYDTGRICWGNVNPRDIRTVADFESLFFGSGFNTDLVGPGAGGGDLARATAAAPGGVLPVVAPGACSMSIASAISRVLQG